MPALPFVPVENRTIGCAFTGKEGKTYRPSMFVTLTLPSYGAVVLAPNAFARDNAAALRSFIAASAEGWRDYIRGDASAGDLVPPLEADVERLRLSAV